MTFTITNKYGHKTKNGMAARILATDLAGPRPIAAAVRCCNGVEEVYSYDIAGQHIHISDLDLMNIEPKVEVTYCNLYQNQHRIIKSGAVIFETAQSASRLAAPESTETHLGTFAARYVDGELISLTKVMPEEIK